MPKSTTAAINKSSLHIAILVPCFNEEAAIQQVIDDFKISMPEAEIFVFDNNSTDATNAIACASGAHVTHVALKGKGNVVRRMFADVEADVYIMVDGDATYDASSAPLLVNKLVYENLDMVVGCRIDEGEQANYRQGHRLGNFLLTASVRSIFGGEFTDMLSGYRAFSRRYVKSFPALAKGFEIETELTVHALELRMPYAEVATPYGSRPEGSESKLSTYRDGFRILKTILHLYMIERPFEFLGIFGVLLSCLSLILSIPVITEYVATGLVPRLPTALLSVGLMLSAILVLVCGLVLDTVTHGRHEVRRLAYLSIPGVAHARR